MATLDQRHKRAVSTTIANDVTVLPRDQHPISRRDISDNALTVLQCLNQADFNAYLVGGGVRDLFLGGHPKDFDVATDATPEQVTKLFRNARIIGKRFKIVHVRYGREIIEVTTFRGHHPEPADQGEQKTNTQKSARSEKGMLLRDNIYGTIIEDAWRRDFTVNALYYTSTDFTVHDFCHGYQDLKHKVIRIIGDPASRYREDPVRMLRAVRFAAKLKFTLHDDTAAPLQELGHLLDAIPAARLFDEVLKLFTTGHALATYKLLRHYGLFNHLFPESDKLAIDETVERLYKQAFTNMDTRIHSGKSITPAFMYAALLWPALRIEMQHQQRSPTPSMQALHEAANHVIQLQNQRTSIPKRFSMPMREIWELQLRLPKRAGRRAEKLILHPRFRAAYDFLLLREEVGELAEGLGKWWTDYQEHNPAQREQQLKALHRPQRRQRKHQHQPNKTSQEQ